MHKNTNPRILLARLRQGNYAHAGGEEAIDIVLEGLLNRCSKGPLKMLDAGCGRGGTADYIKNKVESNIQGIDLDENAICEAKCNYPNIEFIHADILTFSTKVLGPFDVIYLFNVFYALDAQQESLDELAKVSKPGTIIAIFDYINKYEESLTSITDLAGKPMRPVSLSDLTKYFKTTGWELLEIKVLDQEYEIWYNDFIEKMEAQKDVLLDEFTEETYTKVHETFSALLNKIKHGDIGGAVAYGRMQSATLGLFAKKK